MKSLKSMMVNEMASKAKAVKSEEQKEFIPMASNMTQAIALFKAIFDNMHNKRDPNITQYRSPLLTSAPGVGKTSQLNLLSKILGIEMITIEAPHIVEEHIVQIPFIILNPKTDKETAGKTQLSPVGEYSVKMADSNLYTQIKNSRKISDEDLLKSVYASSDDVIQMFEYFGGTETEIPQEFQDIRSSFTCILFLDEYFRQTSMRIKNMLRGLLNNRIATHELPKNAFLIYATNLDDEGVDADIPLNTEFEHFAMENPDKEEWFSWLVFKFQKDKRVKLNKAVIDKFYNILDDSDISKDDFESNVRTSPRRWEQLLLYINASLPVKDIQEAKNLMSNVKLNFKNYLTGQHSEELVKKVLAAVAELIKQTSNVEANEGTLNKPTDWKETLKHQIETREKLGTLRKYIPVIAGLPGVAKTAKAISLAKDMDLRFIDIDVSTLNAEDVVGLPLAKEDKAAGTIETEFSMPVLYQQIMERIHKADKEYQKTLKEENPDDWKEKWKDYEKRNLKYLIFFDEMNRNSPKVFNAMRRVLLEKNFGHGAEHGELLKLPNEALMLAAINPEDAGAQEITKHMRDVLDIIDAPASWDASVEYMKTQKLNGVQPLTMDVALDIVKKFVKKFETHDSGVPLEERAFHWDVGGDIWISPREINGMYLGLARNLEREIKAVQKKNVENLTAKELSKLEDDVRTGIFNSLKRNTSFVFHKQKHKMMKDEQAIKEWYDDLKAWCLNSADIDIGENIFYSKAINTKQMSLMDIIEEHFDGENTGSMAENDDYINFISNINVTQFREDLTDLIQKKLIDETAFERYIGLVKTKEKDENGDFIWKSVDQHPLKVLKGNKIETDPSQKAPQILNFCLEVIYALFINDASNDKLESIKMGASHGLKAFRNAMKTKMEPGDLAAVTDKFVGILDQVDEAIDALSENNKD